MRVKDIYSNKVFSCGPKTTLRKAVELMVHNNTNTLLVVDDAGKFLGLVTSKEIILAILPDFLEDVQIAALAQEGTFATFTKQAENLTVDTFMNTRISQVKLETLVVKVAANVLHQNESRLPVVDDEGKVIGVVTRTQIKNAVANVLGINA